MSRLVGFQERIRVGGRSVLTLADIVPSSGPTRMLIVGKTPSPVSVAAGHYYQGRHGRFLWSTLTAWGLLAVPDGRHEDEVLVEHGHGITDVVKVPRQPGTEPSPDEYAAGWADLKLELERLRPSVTLWTYKGALDKVLRLGIGKAIATDYGFNPRLVPIFGCRVFVFGMPGTPCTSEQLDRSMAALRRFLDGLPATGSAASRARRRR